MTTRNSLLRLALYNRTKYQSSAPIFFLLLLFNSQNRINSKSCYFSIEQAATTHTQSVTSAVTQRLPTVAKTTITAKTHLYSSNQQPKKKSNFVPAAARKLCGRTTHTQPNRLNGIVLVIFFATATVPLPPLSSLYRCCWLLHRLSQATIEAWKVNFISFITLFGTQLKTCLKNKIKKNRIEQ